MCVLGADITPLRAPVIISPARLPPYYCRIDTAKRASSQTQRTNPTLKLERDMKHRLGSVHLPPLILPSPSIAQSITPQPPCPNLIPGLSIVAVCRSDLSPALAMWAGPDLTPNNSSFWLIPQSERQSKCLLWSLDWFKYQHLYNAPYQQWWIQSW